MSLKRKGSPQAGYGVAKGKRRRFPQKQKLLRSVQEPGYVDVALTSFACDTTGSIQHINIVPQGNGVSERVGKRICMKSLQLRGVFSTNASSIFNKCTYMIVYDKRPTGSLPAITDILVSANSTSFNNDNNTGRFRILRRKDVVLCGDTGATIDTDTAAMLGDDFIDLKGLPVVYKAAASGVIADVEEGALYMVTVGNNAAGITAAIYSTGTRLRFYDN